MNRILRFIKRYHLILSLIGSILLLILVSSIATILFSWVKINWIQGGDYENRIKNVTSNLEMQGNPPSRILNTDKIVVYRTIKNGWHDQDLRKISKEWGRTSEDEYPKSLAQLVILSEDKGFLDHNGISSWGVLRALASIGKQGYGSGSTITQQIARKIVRTSYNNASSLDDKLEEQTIAKLLEERYIRLHGTKLRAKEEILLTYMNQVNLGTNVYGFRDAARVYFNRQPYQLSLNQQVKLVAMLSRPESYTCPQPKTKALNNSPEREQALMKNNIKLESISASLLTKLQIFVNDEKIKFSISPYENTPFNVSPSNDYGLSVFCRGKNEANYFANKVEEEVKKISSQDEKVRKIYRDGGFGINATLDSSEQLKAELILTKTIKTYRENFGISDGAIVLMETNTGKVRAMVGTGEEKNNPIMQARPPASTFKIFTYLTAIEKGISPTKLYSCGPFKRPDRKQPDTCRNKQESKINLYQALARSENVIAWRIAEEVGKDTVVKMAAKLGLTEGGEDNTTLDSSFNGLIGQGDTRVSLMKMMQAYSTIANGGIEIKPKYIESIFDTKQCIDTVTRYKKCGDKIYIANNNKAEKVNSKIANTLTELLQGVIYDEKGTGGLARLHTEISSLPYSNDVKNNAMREAGKTGTNAVINNETSDLWFIGYVPSKSLIAGVWLGTSSPGKIKSEDLSKKLGGNLAAKVWREFIKEVAPEPVNNTVSVTKGNMQSSERIAP